MKLSEKSARPVLVLFQEVPGCAGCQKFGREVLSHPSIVEAIEDEFVPVFVYNNEASGRDAELLKRFKEPACIYQVVRFLNSNGKDIIKRQDGIWSTTGIASRMISALKAAKRRVPLSERDFTIGNRVTLQVFRTLEKNSQTPHTNILIQFHR